MTFGTTSSFFLENSHNQTWLTGDVAGWFTLPLSSSTCDYNQISSAADQAATSGGVRLSNYTRKVYAFPQIGRVRLVGPRHGWRQPVARVDQRHASR